MPRSSRRAFTLIDIMIVVAIIAILIAVAVPGFLKARKSSRLAACQENQTKIDSSVQQYIMEHKFPNLDGVATNLAGQGWQSHIVGSDNYLRAEPRCPSGGEYTVKSGEAEVKSDFDTYGTTSTVFCSLFDDPDNEHLYPGSSDP